jgi:hypothetical protein
MPLAVRLPFILLGTVGYLALAILGRGGVATFFSVPALVGLAVAFCAMSGVAIFAGGNLSAGVREDPRQPLGDRRIRGDRSAAGLRAGLGRP